MPNPILVTGAAGRVRAMVRTEDERAQASRDGGTIKLAVV